MGYTHYFTFKTPKLGRADKMERAYQRAIKDCTKVIVAYQKTAHDEERLSGYTVHAPNKYGGLCVNGKQELAHEPFTIREHLKENSFHNFCKTAEKPYDVIVVACLTILKHYLKDCVWIGSDGYKDNWNEGVALANKVLKKKMLNPIDKERKCYTCGK